MSTSRAFTVEVLIKAKNLAAGALGNFSKGFSDALTIPRSLNDAMNVLGRGLAGVVNQLPRLSVEFLKLGAKVQRQSRSLDGLAKSYGTTGGAIVGAMQKASDFTIDRMSAMQAANKAMILDVAKTPEAFGELAEVATVLGRAMGQDAAKSIDDFVTASGRQSRMIADNLGLMVSAGDANRRFADSMGIAVSEMDDAQRKQAFLNEMLRQGRIKMQEMGDTTLDAAGRIEQASAAISTLQQDISKIVVDQIIKDMDHLAKTTETTGMTLSEWLNTVPQRSAEAQAATEDLGGSWLGLNKIATEQNRIMQIAESETAEYAQLVAGLALEQADLERSLAKSTDEVEAQKRALARVARGADTVSTEYLSLITDTEDATDATEELDLQFILMTGSTKSVVEGLERVAAVERETARQTEELAFKMADFALQQTMSFTQFERQVTDSAERFQDQREKLEADHQEKLAKLAERGQATAIKFNEEAEQEKLETLRWRLEQALLQQSEFTDKTKESTQRAKAKAIADLQADIAEQTQLIDDFHAGRLFKAGENVSLLVEQENIAHQERIADLEEAQLKQEELQRQSLGRMVLQSFEAWAQMRGISAEKMLEMRTKIAQEYGLIDEKAASELRSHVTRWETWADGVSIEVSDATATMRTIKQEIDAIPSVKEIQIRVSRILTGGGERGAGREEFEQRGGLGGLGLQFGTSFARGGTFLVGEREPEIITLPPGATATPVSSVTNFNMTVNTRADTASVRQDFEMMQGMAG